MNTNGQVIRNVFNYKNINKDERYMFLMFISIMGIFIIKMLVVVENQVVI